MLKRLEAKQVQPLLLAAILRHDGNLGIRQLDQLLTGRLIEPSVLNEALGDMEARGWIVDVYERPNTYPRYVITDAGRQVADQLSEVEPGDSGRDEPV